MNRLEQAEESDTGPGELDERKMVAVVIERAWTDRAADENFDVTNADAPAARFSGILVDRSESIQEDVWRRTRVVEVQVQRDRLEVEPHPVLLGHLERAESQQLGDPALLLGLGLPERK